MDPKSSAKKTRQNFHARTTLWKLFEIRAQEMDCSIDFLINEAMREYATRNSFLDDLDARPTIPVAEARSATDLVNGSSSGLPRPGRVRTHTSIPPAVPRPREPGSSAPPPIPTVKPVEADRPSAPPQAAGLAATRPRLTMVFKGERIPISGGQFIVGRGAKASDLVITDPNISRKHAAVVFHNGSYFLKDLGSTNGIEFRGERLDSKKIDEGDIFFLCDHELQFTYSR